MHWRELDRAHLPPSTECIINKKQTCVSIGSYNLGHKYLRLVHILKRILFSSQAK